MSWEEYREKEKERNDKILHDRMAAYNLIKGCRVGDWIREPNGRITRATYDWEDTMQNGGGEHGSFYLGEGYISYSGSLDPGIDKGKLRQVNEVKNGAVWFFKNNYWTAGNGISFIVPFRVFEVIDNGGK